MNLLTAFVLVVSAVSLNAIFPRDPSNSKVLDVSDPYVQDMGRNAVAKYTHGIKKDCLKHPFTLKSIEKAFRLPNVATNLRLHVYIVYNTNCPFGVAKTCKKEPNNTDKTFELVIDIRESYGEITDLKVVKAPSYLPDC